MPLCYHAIHTFLLSFAHFLGHRGVDAGNGIKEACLDIWRGKIIYRVKKENNLY